MSSAIESPIFFGHNFPRVDNLFRLPVTLHFSTTAENTKHTIAALPFNGYLVAVQWSAETAGVGTDAVLTITNETSEDDETVAVGTDAADRVAIDSAHGLYFKKGDELSVEVTTAFGTSAATEVNFVLEFRV